MARAVPIGEYQPQVPVEEGLRRIIPSRTPGNVGAAIEDVGASLQKVAQSEAAQYTTQALAKAQSDWTQKLIAAQESAQPGAPDFTKSVMDEYGKYAAQAVKGAPSGMASRFLTQRLTEFGHQLSQKALNFEANARQAHNEMTAKQSVDSTSVELMNDPSVYTQRLAERQSLISSMNLDPQVKEKLSEYAQVSMAGYAVRGDISRDPYQAMLALQDKDQKGYYAHLTSEQREQLMNHADTMLHQRVSDAERVHSLAKQQEQETSDALLKQGIVMGQKGGLTPDWVVARAGALKPEALKYLLDEAAGKKQQSDLHVYADLLDRVGRGEDVRESAQAALFAGQLSKDDYTRITDKAASELPNAYKRGIQYIQTAGKVSELEPDPAKAQTLANMQNDFQDWFKQNPQAKDKEVQEQAQDIVRRYQLVKADQNLLTLPVPRYFEGTRAQPDIDASEKQLRKAIDAREISREEAARQALLLSKWRAALEATQAKAAAKAKPQ